MKSISEIRINFDLRVNEMTSQIKYFKKLNIDWNVFLPSKNRNLQRDYCWKIEQKRELIWSLLIGRHIPHCAVINAIDKEDDMKDINLIIDGKQRLSSIFDFIDDKFTIVIDDVEYLFSELPEEYQKTITQYHFRYYLVNEPYDERITDEQK